jgi:hypothetical protein
MHMLTLDDIHRAARERTLTVHGAKVLRVRLISAGWEVIYRGWQGSSQRATLPPGHGVPPLRRGWFGTLWLRQGEIIGAEEA